MTHSPSDNVSVLFLYKHGYEIFELKEGSKLKENILYWIEKREYYNEIQKILLIPCFAYADKTNLLEEFKKRKIKQEKSLKDQEEESLYEKLKAKYEPNK